MIQLATRAYTYAPRLRCHTITDNMIHIRHYETLRAALGPRYAAAAAMIRHYTPHYDGYGYATPRYYCYYATASIMMLRYDVYCCHYVNNAIDDARAEAYTVIERHMPLRFRYAIHHYTPLRVTALLLPTLLPLIYATYIQPLRYRLMPRQALRRWPQLHYYGHYVTLRHAGDIDAIITQRYGDDMRVT